MAQKNVEKIRKKINWGPDVATLPLWTQADVNNAQATGKNVIIIDNIVHDVTVFVNNHPGGSIIKSYVGTDATAVFYGGVYDHSNAAQNLLSTLRLARYQPDASSGYFLLFLVLSSSVLTRTNNRSFEFLSRESRRQEERLRNLIRFYIPSFSSSFSFSVSFVGEQHNFYTTKTFF